MVFKSGGYCFALGSILYFVVLNNQNIVCSNKTSLEFSSYAVSIMILMRLIAEGSGFDGLLFAVLCTLLIALNMSMEKALVIIDNCILRFLGKHITELFVSHILLYYILVQNQKVMLAGVKAFLTIFALSIVIAPIIKIVITKPGQQLMRLCLY